MSETARDLMQTQVLALSPEDPLYVAQRLFYEEGIHGAPVVDERGRVVGMLTSTDLLRAVTEAHEVAPAEPARFRDDFGEMIEAWQLAPADFEERVRDVRVSDYMTEEVVHVAPDVPVVVLARTLRENRIHRVLVLDDGQLQGIVSTFDLMGVLEARG